MVGSKYLSELVTPDMLVRDKLNIVKAPTGSGKTYFALTAIPATLGEDAAFKVVYLIDTINGREQLLQNYNTTNYSKLWDAIATDEILYWESVDKSIVVITYAKFGKLIEHRPDFHTHFKYIICDELPSLIKYQYFEKQPNLSTIALHGLEDAVRNGQTKVVALTATPNQIEGNFEAPIYTVPFDSKELIRYSVGEVKKYTNLDYLITQLDTSKTGLCYVSRVTKMKELEEKARAHGFNPISIWSIRNTDHIMTEEQLAARDSILKDFTIPPQYNFLIINAASETSLKIKSPVDFVIVHNNDIDTQKQVRGRVNHDISTIYIPNFDFSSIEVPDAFLNDLLFKSDRDKLCEILNLRDENGRLYKWPTVSRALQQAGYKVEPGRRNDFRGYAITLPE